MYMYMYMYIYVLFIYLFIYIYIHIFIRHETPSASALQPQVVPRSGNRPVTKSWRKICSSSDISRENDGLSKVDDGEEWWVAIDNTSSWDIFWILIDFLWIFMGYLMIFGDFWSYEAPSHLGFNAKSQGPKVIGRTTGWSLGGNPNDWGNILKWSAGVNDHLFIYYIYIYM